MTAKNTNRTLSTKRRASSRQNNLKISSKQPVTKPVNAKRKPVSTKSVKLTNDSKKRVNKSFRPTTAMKAKVLRGKDGKILPGGGSNGGGRPRGAFSTIKLNQLQSAISEVELGKDKKTKTKREKWLKHQIIKSYTDTTLATAILGRLFPSLKSIEQVSVAQTEMEIQEAAEIRKELQERCKTKVLKKKKVS